MGVHVDGYIAVAAHTFCVPNGSVGDAPPAALEPITGVRADVMNAAFVAAEVAARVIRPGNTNKQVTEAVKGVAEAYGVQAIAGTLMHQMKRYVIDASKVHKSHSRSPQYLTLTLSPPTSWCCLFAVCR